jgi:tetratricopeptide (TPR) repeat protein
MLRSLRTRRPFLCRRPALAVAIAAVVGISVFSGCADDRPQVSSATQLLIDARGLIAVGENDKALEALNASIESEPSMWSLFERAKLHEKLGDDAAAVKDCDEALKLEPDDRDVIWFKTELKKPAGQRFLGQFKLPPSHNR